MARRELATLRREKTIVLALLIQLFIAAFSSFLLVGLVSLYDPGAVGGAGIAFGVAGNASGTVTGTLEGEGPWRLTEYDDVRTAESAFDAGRVDALLVVNENPSGRLDVDATVPGESVRSTVVVVELRSALETLERERRFDLADRLERSPVPLPEVPAAPPTVGFTYSVLVPLLVFLPVFIAGSVAADAITEELDSGTFELLRVTPLSAVAIVEGKVLAMVGLAVAQAATWLLLLWLNGTPLAAPVAILGLVTATATIVVCLGCGIALQLRDRQSTQLVYSLGVIAVFVAASAFPVSPVNAVARLAVGSHDLAIIALVVAAAVVAIGAVGLLRRSVVATRA